MEGTKYTTKESVLKHAQEAIGIPLGEIDKTGRLATGKGAIGTVIEESWFGYTPNSESEPDFPEAGVELKVTPYIRGNNGIRAKERLVCNIINYMEEYDKTFETSSFWVKCNTMLLMSYEHLYDVSKAKFKIDAAILFGFPEEDLLIIENDWKIIIEKIRSGKAHLISEGDTLYLAACTKGATAATAMRKQPFSAVQAKQRAYSLKSSYMTQILRQYVFGNVQNEKIVRHWEDLQHKTLEQYIVDRVSPYYGLSQQSLKEHFNIKSTAKNINEIILGCMLNIKGRIAQTDEFQKAGIVPKTIRVQKNGKIKEHMDFPTFEFKKIVQESWEESALYNYLAPTKFLFVIFQEDSDGAYLFDNIMFWNISETDLEEVHRVWERTKDIIREGVRLVQTPRGITNNLPKQTESRVSHVRPHSRKTYYRFLDGKIIGDGAPGDASELPDGRMMTKQCFWLNNSFIEQQIKGKKTVSYDSLEHSEIPKAAERTKNYSED